MAFLLDEDEAMHTYFSGLSIQSKRGSNTQATITTRFRMPEQEHDMVFPMITIALVDISEAPDRNQRGRLNLSKLHYNPNGEVPAAQSGYSFLSDFPIPVNLDYQVATLTREAYQDVQMRALLWNRCPGRFGVLRVKDTDRTMQQLGSVNLDRLDGNGKREFRKVYTIRVVSELFPNLIKQVANLTAITIDVPALWPVVVGATATELNCNAEP